MCVVVGRIYAQTVVRVEVAGTAHMNTRSNVTFVVDGSYIVHAVFHGVLTNIHHGGIQRTVSHTSYVTLHGAGCHTPCKDSHSRTFTVRLCIANHDTHAVVFPVGQVFQRFRILVASSFQCDKNRRIEFRSSPFCQRLRLRQCSKHVRVESFRSFHFFRIRVASNDQRTKLTFLALQQTA